VCSADFSNSTALTLASWAVCFALSANSLDFSKYFLFIDRLNYSIDSPRTVSLAAANFSSAAFSVAIAASFVLAAISIAFSIKDKFYINIKLIIVSIYLEYYVLLLWLFLLLLE
jgi:hypothetical protein